MKVVITGGAGFIGCNAAEYYAKKGNQVIIFDNLSRKGSISNLNYLKITYPSITFVYGDIRNKNEVDTKFFPEIKNSDLILHLAAQVAVTTSVANPEDDFGTNAQGTFNILEAVRKLKETTSQNPIFIYSSTNKV